MKIRSCEITKNFAMRQSRICNKFFQLTNSKISNTYEVSEQESLKKS